MYVTGAGRVVIQPGEHYPPSGHPTLYQFDWLRGRTLPEFQLVLITDGAGEFESEATGHVEFEGATLIFVFPGVWHRYRPASKVGLDRALVFVQRRAAAPAVRHRHVWPGTGGRQAARSGAAAGQYG